MTTQRHIPVGPHVTPYGRDCWVIVRVAPTGPEFYNNARAEWIPTTEIHAGTIRNQRASYFRNRSRAALLARKLAGGEPANIAGRLRQVLDGARPKCCDLPMEITFLNLGPKKDQALAALTDEELSEYLAAFAPLPPVWSCVKCGKEIEVFGLQWPPKRAVEETCPHCGQSLPKK